jgi:hypothetical protein
MLCNTAWQISLKPVQGDGIFLGIVLDDQKVFADFQGGASDALRYRCERFFGTPAMPATYAWSHRNAVN